jgi:hypothetical protein
MQHTGILPLGELKLDLELLLLLTRLKLSPDLRDDLCPPASLIAEVAEAAEKHHDVGVGAASQSCAFG